MRDKVVGILGGSGSIGTKCVDILKGKYKIIATFRENRRKSSELCKYIKVDIDNPNELLEFFKQINILINCAGASYKNGERIAKMASDYNIPYIDPSGESFLEDKLKDKLEDNIFVLSSGYFPGLSGIMANYACDNLKDIELMQGFNISEEIPSKSAIEDFVLTNLSGFGKSLYSYKNKEYVYDDSFKYENINGKIYQLSNYITREFIRIAEKFNVKHAKWFNQVYGEEVIRKMQEIILKKHGFDYRIDIEEIILIFEKNVCKEKFNKLKIVAKNNTESIEIEVDSPDSSIMSAIICANTVKEVLEKNYKNGLYYAMDILNFQNIKNDLKKNNVKVNVKKEKSEYEEGVI